MTKGSGPAPLPFALASGHCGQRYGKPMQKGEKPATTICINLLHVTPYPFIVIQEVQYKNTAHFDIQHSKYMFFHLLNSSLMYLFHN